MHDWHDYNKLLAWSVIMSDKEKSKQKKYTPNSVIIISDKLGSDGPIITAHLKMQLSNDSSNFST